MESLKNAKGRRVTVRMEETRIFAIKNYLPAVFKVSPSRRGSGAAPSHRRHDIGAEAFRKHDETVVRESARFGVNPDLVRAILYIENADGFRAGLDPAKQAAGLANTLLPMNINPTIWDGVGGVRGDQFKNPELNIRAGVALIMAIQDRIENPTPAKSDRSGSSQEKKLSPKTGRRSKEPCESDSGLQGRHLMETLLRGGRRIEFLSNFYRFTQLVAKFAGGSGANRNLQKRHFPGAFRIVPNLLATVVFWHFAIRKAENCQ
jgi:hypothetical protein